MHNELSVNQTEFQTKLNKALAPDENGMVSAKHLYEMLGLSPSNYSKWCKSNFFTDFGMIDGVEPSNYPFVPKDERTNTEVETAEVLLNQMKSELEQIGVGIQPNPSQDYLITIRIATKICLKSKSEHRDEILEYFLDLEEAAPKSALALQERDAVIEKLVSTVENLAQLTKSNTDTIKELKTEVFSHIDLLESKSEVMLTHETDWAMDMMEHVRKIADVYTHGDTSKCMDRLAERAEEYLGEPYKNYEADYAMKHNGKRGKKILVMARDEDSRSAFEQAVKDYEIEFGIYEQNEGQKYLDTVLAKMGQVIIPDPPEYQHEKTNEELAAEYEAMTKMYGEGWDKQPDIPTAEEIYGN